MRQDLRHELRQEKIDSKMKFKIREVLGPSERNIVRWCGVRCQSGKKRFDVWKAGAVPHYKMEGDFVISRWRQMYCEAAAKLEEGGG